MSRFVTVLFGASSLVSACSSEHSATGSSSNPLVGVWELHSWVATLPDGRTIHPFGDDAVGRISYDEAGRMAVQIMRRGRPPFADGDVFGGTTEEVVSAHRGFIAYFGTYRVRAQENQVIHSLDASSFPNWEGSEQVRTYRLTGDTLRLSPPAIESAAYDSARAVSAAHILTWVRQ